MRHNCFRLASLMLAGIAMWAAAHPPRLLAGSQADSGKAAILERLTRVSGDLFAGTNRDKIGETTRELKAILALDPGSAEAHMLLGIAYRTQGSAELMGEAIAEFRQALALNPNLAPARLYLAHVYLDLGRPGRAREELETALVQVPGQPQVLALLGETERQLKNPRRSVEVLRLALKRDESFVQARYYLGLALFDLGQRDEAIKELERVVQTGPNAVEAYVSLGTAYLEAGRVDAALETLSRGTHVDPARPDLRIQLARAFRSKGQLARAEEQLKIAMPEGENALASPSAQRQQVAFDLQVELGLLRMRQGRLEAAAQAFQKALDMDPNHEPTKRHMADVRKLMQDKTGKKPVKGRQ